jgi:NADH dehydrogenase
MNERKRIIILGGGYAGVAAAKHLVKKVGKNRNIEITLIDRNRYQTLMTELHEVAGGRVEQGAVQVSFAKIFGGRPIALVQDDIETIDFKNQIIVSPKAKYPYDYLLLGVGGEPEDFGTPGIAKHAFTLWSLDDALKLREHIERMFFLASTELDQQKRRELLRFVVAGAGFTGVEMLGELLDWKSVLARKYFVDESEVSLLLVEAVDKILPILPESLQRKAQRYIEKRGAEVLLGSKITKAAADSFVINGEKEIRTHTLIWTCGIHGCEFAGNLQLTKGRCANKQCSFASTQGTCGERECQFAEGGTYVNGKRGRLLANSYMQSADYPNVYIAGDVLWYLENEKVLPQIVETAIQTGECAAHNIIADIEGTEKREFSSSYHGFMVSIGAKWGVAHVVGMSMSGIFAILSKHLINVVHLLGVAGINAVWGYLKHEFFDIREKRSVTRGLLSAKVPIYWVTILRVFIGAMWFVEGLKKILEGWLKPENASWINSFMFGIVPKAVDGVASASSAASGAAEAAVEAVEAVTAATAAAQTWAPAAAQVADSVTAATDAAGAAVAEAAAEAVTAATAAAAQAGDAVVDLARAASAAANAAGGVFLPAISKPWGLYKWIIGIFVGDGSTAAGLFFADLFRYIVVLGEVAVGLALIGGLFTFLASGASIILGLMFIMAGMATREILWYIFGAIALLGGAGKGLGLDHWVMPWIKGWWNGTRLAQKTYLYLDEPIERRRRRGAS